MPKTKKKKKNEKRIKLYLKAQVSRTFGKDDSGLSHFRRMWTKLVTNWFVVYPYKSA
jgi:hypothetical protein